MSLTLLPKGEPTYSVQQRPFEWFPEALSFIRRRWRTIMLVTISVIALAVVYLQFATPQYTATTQLLIDAHRTNVFHQDAASAADSDYNNAVVESQVEVLQTDGLARQVVRKLDLANDRQFLLWGLRPWRMIVGKVLRFFEPHTSGSGGFSEEFIRQELATTELLDLIKVKRLGLSYNVELSVRTPDPVRSAQLANAIATTFIDNDLQAKTATTRDASTWLQERLRELGDQSIAADRAAQDYKAENHIVDTEKGLMEEHQLADLSTQVVQARTRTADAAARLSRITQMKQSGSFGDTTVTDALQSPVIVKLRQDYLDAQQRETEWSAKFGPNHQVAVNLRAQMQRLRTALNGELDRIASAYRSDFEVAQQNEVGLEARLSALVASSASTNDQRVKLRALESLADTYRTLYTIFLQRYTQAAQDQSFPISQARVVAAAQPPIVKSRPLTFLILIGSVAFGVIAGTGVALAAEMLDKRLCTVGQVRVLTGLDCLSVLPVLRRRAFPAQQKLIGSGPGELTGPRMLPLTPSFLRATVELPQSDYTESLRNIWVRLSQRRRERRDVKVIGCVSADSGEGKSTVSANLAQLFASAGSKTLLIDWDMRKPSLSLDLTAGNEAGFIDVVRGAKKIDEVIWRDSQTGLHFVPASLKTRIAHPAEFLGSEYVRAIMTELKQSYDYIVVDLPPLGPVSDAHAAVEVVDAYVVVIEWGRDQDAVIDALSHGNLSRDRLLGFVLNKVDMKAMRQRSSYGYGSGRRSAG